MTASIYTAPSTRGVASGIPTTAASITGTGYRYALVGRRLLALLIDVLLVAVVGVVVFLLSGRSLAFAALCVVQVIAVQWGWEAGRGRTLGKTIMGLRVVRATHDIAESGAGLLPPGAFRALLRTMTTVVTGAIAVVGAFAAECSSAMDSVRHRGLQDVISGTSVIDERIRYVSVDSRDDGVTDRTGTDLTGDDDLDEMVTGGFVLPPSAEAADNSASAPSIMASRMAVGPSPASSDMAFAAQSATAKPKPVTQVPAAPAGPAEAQTRYAGPGGAGRSRRGRNAIAAFGACSDSPCRASAVRRGGSGHSVTGCHAAAIRRSTAAGRIVEVERIFKAPIRSRPAPRFGAVPCRRAAVDGTVAHGTGVAACSRAADVPTRISQTGRRRVFRERPRRASRHPQQSGAGAQAIQRRPQ